MHLRTQILLSVLGITILAQVVFGLLAYQQITEDNNNPLTTFFQYIKATEKLTASDNRNISEIHLKELRDKFSTPDSILLIQKNNKIIYSTENIVVDLLQVS